MQVDALTMLTFCLSLPNLKLYLTDSFLVVMVSFPQKASCDRQLINLIEFEN
ncbi:MAG: hypothetical protein V7L04_26580 [Nostoc sp.]|uniref:hypothetical protein n=1 Tax=Nostoc sp. TaxID=1180 RepID=UPI002FF50F4E